MINCFREELSNLKGQRCVGVIAGTGSGSMMTIELGGPIPRGGVVRNVQIPEILQNFRGEYCVFVEGCAWRLHHGDGILCGWRNDEKTIRETVEVLAGREVTRVELLPPGLDLILFFSGGYTLYLFCDLTAGDLDNYSVRFPSGWYSVQPNGGLRRDASSR